MRGVGSRESIGSMVFNVRSDDRTGRMVIACEGVVLNQEDILAILDNVPSIIPIPENASWPTGSVQVSSLILQLDEQKSSLVGECFQKALILRKIERVSAQIVALERRRAELSAEAMGLVVC